MNEFSDFPKNFWKNFHKFNFPEILYSCIKSSVSVNPLKVLKLDHIRSIFEIPIVALLSLDTLYRYKKHPVYRLGIITLIPFPF